MSTSVNKPHTDAANGGIAEFAVRHPHFTIVVFIAVSILGVLSAFMVPKDLLPVSNQPAVQILSFYPGMPARNVEEEITFPFERYTGQAVGVEAQDSRSLMGVGIVRNYFNPGIDLSNAISQTGSLVMSVMRRLPPGTQPPLILPFDPMASLPLALVSISSDTHTESELQDLGRYRVTNAIQSVPGAMAPVVMGGKTRQAIVYLNQEKLRHYNLSSKRVAETLNAMNTFIPAGDIAIGDYDYQVISNGLFTELPLVNDFYLRSKNGVAVSVKQVGEAKDSSAIQTNVVHIDGKPEVYVPIYRQPGANSINVIDEVRRSIKTLEDGLHGFKLSVVNDQTIFIRKAIESITHEAFLGGGLAALMVLFFLGSVRATIAVLLSLPISILGALAALKMTGETLNVMTLGGIALSVGVLVDNAIVVIEVIMKKLELGSNPVDASIQGAQEVAMPVLASTLATLIIFLPVLFLKGVVHTLFSALSIAVISAMIASYFAAMMVIPLFTARFLKKETEPSTGILGGFQSWINRMTEAYGRTLSWVVARARIILPVSSILLVLTGIGLGRNLGSEFFPKADAGSFTLHLRGPTGYRVQKTGELADKVEQKIRELIPFQDLKMIIINAGVYYGYPAAFTPNSGTQDAFFNIELTEDRRHTSQFYAKLLRQKLPVSFPDLEFGYELGGLLSSALNGGLIAPIDIQIGGFDPKEAHEFATTLLLKLKMISGAVDVRIRQRFDSPEIRLQIDRRKASDIGLSADTILKNIVGSIANSSSYSPSVWIDPKTGIDYLFGVQMKDLTYPNAESILDIPITSQDQDRSVSLREVASLGYSKGPTELNHVNLKPVVDIYMDAEGRDIGSVANDAKRILDSNPAPKGYWTDIRGEISEMKRSLGSLSLGFVLAALFVYLILVAQFRSFSMPAIVMTTVPMGLVGVILLMSLWPTFFSIQAAIGCIFVIGVAVSHGVLLLEAILEKTHQGLPVQEAILTGAKTRLRPILMTSLASILGLIPMAFGLGQGAEANIPLGRAVIGGQILSTLLNFYLVPSLFSIFFKGGKK